MTSAQIPPADDSASQQGASQSDDAVNATAELAKWKDIAARAQADLQNARMRMEKEGQEMRVYAVQALIERLLPTIDNFRRSFEHLPADLVSHEWVKGLKTTEEQLLKDLEAVGLKRIHPLGQPVDPHGHEVIQVAPGEKDTVVKVLEDGYELSGKVIKPARVVAGSGE